MSASIKMKNLLWLVPAAVVVIFSLAAPSRSASQAGDCQAWVGKYEYEEYAGRNVPGIAMFVEHTIEVKADKDGYTANLVSEGYQTDESILCDIKCSGNKTTLLFRDYLRGGTKLKHGVALYKAGQPLLTLSSAGRLKVITTWQGFLINKDKAKPGVYFKRSETGKK